MSDVAAPAAPVTNGATPTPTPTPAPAPKTPTPASSAAPATTPKPTNGKAPTTKPPAPGQGKPGEPAAAAAKEELFEIVVNGEKKQLTRDQAIRQLQKNSAADQKFQKASEAVKKTNAILGMLTKDTKAALTQAGVDVRAFAEQVLQEAVEEAELTPEQRQHRQDVKELERLREFEKTQKELEGKRIQDEKDKATFAQLEKVLLEHAAKGGLEGTPENLERCAETAMELLDLEVPFTPEQLIAEVKEREDAAFGKLEKKVLGGLKGEALAKRLGPAVVEEVLRWSVERLRGGPPPAPKASETPPAPKASQYTSDAEFRKKYGF